MLYTMGFVNLAHWWCILAPVVMSMIMLTCCTASASASASAGATAATGVSVSVENNNSADHSGSRFTDNYVVTWGGGHVVYLDGGSEVQLSMDQSSGAGFSSSSSYGSGFFHMRIKLPNRDTAGIVTAYYMSSSSEKHDELDFEFLGNREGKPVTLQTNIYINGQGGREQRLNLWFDPTADFHDYKILWNPHQIVFWVDETPIRVLRNLTSKGAEFPSQPMKLIASLWNGDSWATDGGLSKTNWSFAPFTAHFRGFEVAGCVASASNYCASPSHWWNGGKYQALTPDQTVAYENVKKNYMKYNYCTDRTRYPTMPPECTQT